MIETCAQCTLYKPGLTQYVPFTGPKGSKGMLVGEAPGCFIGDTPFFTESGVESIDHIFVGNKTLNGQHIVHNLTYCVTHYPIISFKINKYPEYTCTYQHKILVCTRDKKLKSKLPQGLHAPQWLTADQIHYKVQSGMQVFVLIDKNTNSRIIRNQLHLKAIKNTSGTNRTTNKLLPDNILITKNIAFLLGCFMGDGYANFKNSNISIYLSKGYKQQYVSYVCEGFKKLGLMPHIKHINKVIKISVYSRTLATLFNMLFGTNCYNKRVPKILFTHTHVNISSFLFGWYISDGSHKIITCKGQNITTVSKSAAWDAVLLGIKCGVLLGINPQKPARENEQPTYRINFDTTAIKKLKWNIPTNKTVSPNYGEDNKYWYLRITNTKQSYYTGTVYDKTTSKHTYSIPFIVHNSDEVKQGEPFVGKSGMENDKYLRDVGLTRSLFRIGNCVNCRPPDNRDPTELELACCFNNLYQELLSSKPQIVGTLGRYSTRWFLGPDTDMELVHGIPFVISQLPGGQPLPHPTVIVPIYHPSFGLHDQTKMAIIYKDYEMLAAMFKQSGPIPRVPGQYSHAHVCYEWVPDLYQLKAVLNKYAEYVAIDTESLTGQWGENIPWCLTFCASKERAFMIRANQPDLLAYFTAYANDRLSLLHNAPYDIPVLQRMGVTLTNYVDTMQMAYLLQDEPKGLKPLSYRICNMQMTEYNSVVGEAQEAKALTYLLEAQDITWPDPEPLFTWTPNGDPHIKHPQNIGKKIKRALSDYGKGKCKDLWARWHSIAKDEGRGMVEAKLGIMPPANLSDIPFERAVFYACRDAHATYEIYPYLCDRITTEGLTEVLECDMSMMPTVIDMRTGGMPIDPTYLRSLSTYYEKCMDDTTVEYEQAHNKLTGGQCGHINLGSPKQVLASLKELGARVTDTNEKTLDKVKKRFPIVNIVAKYRGYDKNKGTYSEKLPLMMDPDSRVRSDISTSGTTTGRLKSSQPNLQNVPVRTEEGRKIKQGFVAEPGCVIVSADYSQIEMRIAAEHSGDPIMLDAFRRGADIHSETAAWIFKLPLDQVDKDKHRYPCKRVGFGILYAIGPTGLQDQLLSEGLEYTESYCQFLINSWFERYHHIYSMMEGFKAEARRTGRVHDMFGRYRLIPGARSAHKYIVSAALRQACNAPIQSGATAVVKQAMADLKPVYEAFSEGGKYVCRPLNQIHDDLMSMVSLEILSDFMVVKKQVMESAVTLSIPTPVDLKTGPRWSDMTKYNFE